MLTDLELALRLFPAVAGLVLLWRAGPWETMAASRVGIREGDADLLAPLPPVIRAYDWERQ
jgi:hypothetical protein